MLGPRPLLPPFAGAALMYQPAPAPAPPVPAPASAIVPAPMYNYSTPAPAYNYTAPALVQPSSGPAWDQSALINALQQMSMQQQHHTPGDWYLDTGATSHLASSAGILHSSSPCFSSSHIVVGNGDTLPITRTGHLSIPTTVSPLQLHNIPISPSLIKNLIYVRALTRDNPINIEFDTLGFSVKDHRTRREILRYDSFGDLYPITPASPSLSTSLLVSVDADTWHQRLGHPGRDNLSRVLRTVSCTSAPSHTCHACRLGKNVRFPFQQSKTVSLFPFQLVHCDVWTSPI